MRLLKKDELFAVKASEKRQEIDVGMKLAQRVDSLRQLNTKEELNLTKFREETTKIVQEEIDNLITKKNELDFSVRVLEGKKKLLSKPFEEEWESISNSTIAELNSRDLAIQKREELLAKSEKTLQERFNDYILEKRSLDVIKSSTEKDAQETQEKLIEARKLWVETKQKSDKAAASIASQETSIKNREIEIAYKEKDFLLREEVIQEAAKELANRERFINDKYKTLQRTIQTMEAKGIRI
jgi:hypothetical protein